MIIIHHLERSRSFRVLWLLEEVGVPYDLVTHKRTEVGLAPAEMCNLHPLGKSPIVEIDGEVIVETGAIFETVLDLHDGHSLRPSPGSPEFKQYRYWLHASEGSYMPPFVTELLLSRMETAPMPFFVRPIARRLANGLRSGYLDRTIKVHLDFVETHLAEMPWFTGEDFSAADILMGFSLEVAKNRGLRYEFGPATLGFLDKITERPGYQRARDKSGSDEPMR